jgi:hypothetical protein
VTGIVVSSSLPPTTFTSSFGIRAGIRYRP